jgi:hypothetical protein
MKYLILTFAAFLSITCFGQIALEHSYAGITRYHFIPVNIENIGYKYMALDNNGQFIFFTEDGIKLSVLKADTIAEIYSLPGNYRPATAENTLSFTNDTLYINNNKAYLGDYRQKLSLSNDTLYLTDGGWVYIGTNDGTNIEGVIENPDNQISNIYPNPTDKMSVVLRYRLPENVQDGALNIYGTNGNLVRSISLEPTKNLEELNISFLSAGTYLYQVESSAGRSNLNKLIVY